MGTDKLLFWPTERPSRNIVEAGFRLGHKGTHTSRTIMLSELTALLAATGGQSARTDYSSAIIEANVLGKPTASTRRLTDQRLSELYALEPAVPLFRILRRLWGIDQSGRSLLAVLAALARDPLLRTTAQSVLSLSEGVEFMRDPMKQAVRSSVGNRLNESTLEKVVRNAASSWTQSGHLIGRTFKRRRIASATPPAIAFSLYLAYAAGFRGRELFTSGWLKTLDCTPDSAEHLALSAKRLGLIDLRIAGDVLELGFERLDPLRVRTLHGTS